MVRINSNTPTPRWGEAEEFTSLICQFKRPLTKAHQPKIHYLFSSPHGYVPLNDFTSQTPMRLTRRGADPPHGPLSYGQYFKAITDVISSDRYRPLIVATAKHLAKDISLSDIEEILVYTEKHGSDYHPARIEVVVNELRAAFVMNVAATTRGKARLCREFEVLECLNSKYDFPFLPRTYFQGEAFHPSMVMFLADWFEGYHEFHPSLDHKDNSPKLVLWDTPGNPCRLSRSQVWQIYHQAASILTLYYDIETFEQIFPWHHAAGDFVVKPREKSIDVKLVTARQYAPMLERSEGVPVQEALLFFLLNLSIRMRLDRLDGVGDVVWADDDCVDATLEGFVEGLRTNDYKGAIDTGFVNGFLQYLASLAKEDLSNRLHAIIDACDQAAPDMPVIMDHLKGHISKLHFALQNLRDS
ncbi:MAG: hypothetical protein BA865_00085 [Desulfobacterales bacterium S5133MH4]|nr:MAG: hypothetical protein BA865_00085 [Desulfobacterales bacterium S5133MH4]